MSERAKYALACLEQGMSVQAAAAAAGMSMADVSVMRSVAGGHQRADFRPSAFQAVAAYLSEMDDLGLRQTAATVLGIIASRSGMREVDRIVSNVAKLTADAATTPRERLIQRISEMAEASGSSWREIVGRERSDRINHIRQRGYRIARDAGLSMPAIGELFGGRDHTTVLSGLRAYEARQGAK